MGLMAWMTRRVLKVGQNICTTVPPLPYVHTPQPNPTYPLPPRPSFTGTHPLRTLPAPVPLHPNYTKYVNDYIKHKIKYPCTPSHTIMPCPTLLCHTQTPKKNNTSTPVLTIHTHCPTIKQGFPLNRSANCSHQYRLGPSCTKRSWFYDCRKPCYSMVVTITLG